MLLCCVVLFHIMWCWFDGVEGVVWCHVCCVVYVMLSCAVLCDDPVLCCAISYHVVLCHIIWCVVRC